MIMGPVVDSAAVIVGGLGGAALAKVIPLRIRTALPLTFGLASMGLGIVFIVDVKQLPAVVLALIVGSLIGEWAFIEVGVTWVGNKARAVFERLIPHDASHTTLSADAFSNQFVAVLVLFSASGTGIFGALTNGMTGDPTILLAKSILDFFTAAIFATALGYVVAAIFIPQFVIQMTLALCAGLLLPLTTPMMNADFSACGGLIMLATGFRICGITKFPVVNFLPALVLVMPFSYLWTHFAP